MEKSHLAILKVIHALGSAGLEDLISSLESVRKNPTNSLDLNALTDCAAGDLILVAVSGGADSLALAYALSLKAPKLALRVEGVTVDHHECDQEKQRLLLFFLHTNRVLHNVLDVQMLRVHL